MSVPSQKIDSSPTKAPSQPETEYKESLALSTNEQECPIYYFFLTLGPRPALILLGAQHGDLSTDLTVEPNGRQRRRPPHTPLPEPPARTDTTLSVSDGQARRLAGRRPGEQPAFPPPLPSTTGAPPPPPPRWLPPAPGLPWRGAARGGRRHPLRLRGAGAAALRAGEAAQP